MNEEKSHKMFFSMLFGIMGMALLILAWLIPADASDRIIAAVVGSAGLFGAAIRIPTLRRITKTDSEQVTVKAETEEGP
jgi:hypothetical protein